MKLNSKSRTYLRRALTGAVVTAMPVAFIAASPAQAAESIKNPTGSTITVFTEVGSYSGHKENAIIMGSFGHEGDGTQPTLFSLDESDFNEGNFGDGSNIGIALVPFTGTEPTDAQVHPQISAQADGVPADPLDPTPAAGTKFAANVFPWVVNGTFLTTIGSGGLKLWDRAHIDSFVTNGKPSPVPASYTQSIFDFATGSKFAVVYYLTDGHFYNGSIEPGVLADSNGKAVTSWFTIETTAGTIDGVSKPSAGYKVLNTETTATLSEPHITSAASATFQTGIAGSATVVASGTPTPTLEATGLPTGVTFTDNGNGTGTIAGTIAADGSSTITITATNSEGTDTQTFTLTASTPSTTGNEEGVPPHGISPEDDNIDITATVPVETGGDFVWTVGAHSTVLATRTVSADKRWQTFTGNLPKVTVTDTRYATNDTLYHWNINGVAGAFKLGGVDKFSSKALGWLPALGLNEQGALAEAGTQVDPSYLTTDSGTGLSTSRNLGKAADGRDTGATELNAGLTLTVPATLSAGTYTSKLTLTATY